MTKNEIIGSVMFIFGLFSCDLRPSDQDLGRLPPSNFMDYTIDMEGFSTILIIILITVVVYLICLRWWRFRRAAKLADKLLADVIKGKDSFRR